MANEGESVRSGWVPITIRLKVRAGSADADIFALTDKWEGNLRPYIRLDRTYEPVPVRPPRAQVAEFREKNLEFVVVRALVDPRVIPDIEQSPYVDHVARDARLEPFARIPAELAFARVDCGIESKADGTAADVARYLGVTRLRAAGLTGRGIVVGVVDGGITAHSRPTQAGGWHAIPQEPATGDVIAGWPMADWGTTAEGWGQHGNMIAYDVQAMAPEAELWDMRIWQSGDVFSQYVSNAERAYQHAIEHFRAYGTPQILVNSWGLYDSDNGPDYAFNPQSNLVLLIEHALDAGMLILFAAGNCGDGCPVGSLCGSGNRGPGASILGPNGHPEVMTVGAATVRGDWCGYTSQGPAVLPPNDPDKPDFCSVSQFEGFFPNESGLRPFDGGTSAAAGIAAGVVALLKQARPDLTQEECRRVLRDTARPIRTPAAHEGAGAGVIDALRAVRAL